jgi:Domain of unknown function (DUF4177)
MYCATCGEPIPEGHVFVARNEAYCAVHAPAGSQRSSGTMDPLPQPQQQISAEPPGGKGLLTRWEYRVFKFSTSGAIFRGGKIPDEWLATELNKLGQQGWELVGTFTSAIGSGATNEVAVILKRQLSSR